MGIPVLVLLARVPEVYSINIDVSDRFWQESQEP